MCGIAVIVGNEAKSPRSECEVMSSHLVHRGPDGDGLWEGNGEAAGLVMAHRRLSILDLSPTGSQPMLDPVSGNVIIFNGEIYNFRAIRHELENLGASFRGTSDTEVVLYGFRQWGVEVFRRLQGMFALAIFAKKENKLVLARDGVGIKPLYWGNSDKGLFACSELQAIMRSGLVHTKINRAALIGLLAYGSVPEPLTLVDGVTMFPPGHYAEVDLNQSRGMPVPVRFWSPPDETLPISKEEAVDRLRGILEDAVRTHLESDAPLGLFLSGGLDSTVLTLEAARIASLPLTTLTVAFPGMGALDESPVAAETARRAGSKHLSVTLSTSQIEASARQWVDRIDQPSMDGLNTFIVSQAAHEAGLKVVWSGLGGDELFGGYDSFRQLPSLYRRSRVVSWMPASMRRAASGLMTARMSPHRQAKALEMADDLNDFAALALRRRRLFSDAEINCSGLVTESVRVDSRQLPAEFELPRLAQSDDLVAALSAIETSVYMRNTLLRDSDVCGMAHSIEIRVPLLHTPLVEFVMSLPGELRVRRGSVNKPLLAEACGDPYAAQVASQRKRGFSLPYQRWLRGPFREQLTDGIDQLKASQLFSDRWIDDCWQTAIGKENAPWNRAWMLGVLGLWLQKHTRQVA